MYKGLHDARLNIHQLSKLVIDELRDENIHLNTVCDFGARHGEGYHALIDIIDDDTKFIFVEPEPTCIDIITSLKQEKKHQLKLIDSIVSDHDGKMILNTFERDDKQSSNVFSDRGGRYGKVDQVEVNVISYDTFFDAIGTRAIEFVKMNIEGFEYEMIDHRFFHNHVHSFVIELHNGLVTNKNWKSAIDALSDQFDLYVHGDVNYKYCFVRGIRCK